MRSIWINSVNLTVSMVLLMACSGGSAEANIDPEHTDKTYTVLANAEFAPFEYEENGQVEGFTRDILQAASDKVGVKLQFRNVPWEGIFPTLDTGDADIIASSVTITDERRQSMDFSDPYFEATQSIVTAADTSIRGFSDLKDKRVSVLNGSTGDIVMQKIQGNNSQNIKRFESMPLALSDLLKNGVDASVGDNGVIQNFIANNKDVKLNVLNDPSAEKEYYGFVVKKGRQDDLLPKINEGLKEIKADGQYNQIYTKYFGT